MRRSDRPMRPVYFLGLGLLSAPLLLANNGKGNTLCIDDECVDGSWDMTLTFTLSEVEFREQSFREGMTLQVNGSEPPCYDSPCSQPRFYVRSATSGRLLAARFGGVPVWMRTADGIDYAPLSPLTYETVEPGLCTPWDAGCGDGTTYNNGTVDVILEDDDSTEYARLVSRTGGWGPGGYYVSVGSLITGDYSCDGPTQGLTSIILDACDADSDCPSSDVATTCDTPDPGADRVSIDLNVPRDSIGDYEAYCEVLSTTGSGGSWTVDLDCVYTLELEREEEDEE